MAEQQGPQERLERAFPGGEGPDAPAPLEPDRAAEEKLSIRARATASAGGALLVMVGVLLLIGTGGGWPTRDVAGLICVFIGAMLLQRASATLQQPGTGLPEGDRKWLMDLLEKGDDKEAVDQYIRLTGLKGMTGFFHTMGLTGLPLATIGFTLFFALAAMIPGLEASTSTKFMELAQTTLGGFLGSFVQKQQSAASARSHAGELPL